ncbi:monofunctional biosynthetic peptidoglycan transglycosylase [Brevirhabdus pacifica]|uniref:Biosynthetic peptidoglycan transglycosylase n=1 Tax=Brevirhabdus pacifica TaxID=1267768 RepID=A0A1U7DM81_9RHOB|nr:monofunctional biosynthetic peptidoglycan transglycosylase [Brevirhabdus pacifica]APX91081.1 monofunctional biosynthetic peptidoglycan transglycosylase [Brevirhabdus pacifica]OWU74398.1 peptidoglycan transglycosylase [Loktanella sp. 22II-4b]
MARQTSSRKSPTRKRPAKKSGRGGKAATPGLRARILRWIGRGALAVLAVLLLSLLYLRFFSPPTTYYMAAEAQRLGSIDHQWVPLSEMDPSMPLSAVAAEDANFCQHWGFDMAAIRKALDDGGQRGASTISQQTVKNVYLWQGRSWTRKALEAILTPMAEAAWPKRRILELYLNVAEFDEGVFGVDAAAFRYFRTSASELTPVQSARLAAILPDPKDRSAARPTDYIKKRTRQIMDGAATLRLDGRARCFAG